MADNSLRRLRREAGFTSAKAFAEHVGIPGPTYAKYEQIDDGPETSMPIKNAWAIADALGCSIDELVGRRRIVPDAARGGVQEFYDGLSDAGKAKMEDYMGYLAYLDDQQARRRAEQRELEMALIEKNLEQMYLASLDDAFAYRSPARMRAGFEEFVAVKSMQRREEEKGEVMFEAAVEIRRPLGLVEADGSGCERILEADDPKIEAELASQVQDLYERKMREIGESDGEVMKEIMAAYDKAHPGSAPKGGTVEYAFVSL